MGPQRKTKLKADKYGNPPQFLKGAKKDYSWVGSDSTKSGATDQARTFKRKWSKGKTEILPFKKSGKLKWILYAVRSPKEKQR